MSLVEFLYQPSLVEFFHHNNSLPEGNIGIGNDWSNYF
jgi:hypothetical protein